MGKGLSIKYLGILIIIFGFICLLFFGYLVSYSTENFKLKPGYGNEDGAMLIIIGFAGLLCIFSGILLIKFSKDYKKRDVLFCSKCNKKIRMDHFGLYYFTYRCPECNEYLRIRRKEGKGFIKGNHLRIWKIILISSTLPAFILIRIFTLKTNTIQGYLFYFAVVMIFFLTLIYIANKVFLRIFTLKEK